MLSLIYSFGSLVAFVFFIATFINLKLRLEERVVVYSASILPLGKLIYFPLPGLYGLKVAFLYSCFAAVYYFLKAGLSRDSLCILVYPLLAGILLVFVYNYDLIFFYEYREIAGFDAGMLTGTYDSVLARLIVFGLILLYTATIFSLIRRRSMMASYVARYFVFGTIAACLIGCLIFLGVWQGVISVEDLSPISVDSHLTGDENRFYRFNPGANVNEFSMIIAFALFLLYFSQINRLLCYVLIPFFFICEFAALTRSSWIGIVIGSLVGIIFSGKFKKLIPLISVFLIGLITAFVWLYFSFPEVEQLINSRTALDIGVSGGERLEKFAFALESIISSPLRLLLGFGWATNLYVHNVYIQLLYEVGVFGFVAFVAVVGYFVRHVAFIPASFEKGLLIAIVVFILLAASMQHTLYHGQTWLMLGFCAAVAFNLRKCCNGNPPGN